MINLFLKKYVNEISNFYLLLNIFSEFDVDDIKNGFLQIYGWAISNLYKKKFCSNPLPLIFIKPEIT